MKSGPETELLERYLKRLHGVGRGIGLSGIKIEQIAESRHGDAATRCREEAAALVARAGTGSTIVALDQSGKNLASEEIAALLRRHLDGGEVRLAFAIGGPDGHGPQVLEAAKLRLAFGNATWPHQLVRVMLAEQLYRAVTILAGHPYHRA